MTNRVDFYLTQERRLGVPAGRCVVLVDGVVCPYLSVKEIVRSCGPEYGWARLEYEPALWPDGEPVAVECIERIAGVGKRVRVEAVYDGGAGFTAVETMPLFAGRIERIDTEIGGEREAAEIVARDYASRLNRVTVFGQRVIGSDGRCVRLDGEDLVFNRAGLPNASGLFVQQAGRWYRMFEGNRARSRRWTCAEAVQYLLSEHLSAGEIAAPCIEELEGLFGGRILRAIDVTGMSLLRAIEKCCAGAGVEFRFEPFEADGCEERIVFYRPGFGRAVELNHQAGGESFSVLRTNVHRVSSVRSYRPVTHRFMGRGGWKTYEATFELVKAWDPSLEGAAREVYSPSTNADFASVRDVYRRWCLNEAGDYTGAPYNRGEAFDLGRVFEGSEYVRRRRRFESCLSMHDGKSLGRHLEVSYDGGSTWEEYTGLFEVLDEECGVRLSGEELEAEVWSAITSGTLRFRITAAVASDSRLTVSVADGPVGSAVEVVEHIIEAGEFQYRKLSAASVFGGVFEADERDDSEALHSLVRYMCGTYESGIETIYVETPIVAQFYLPGDRVTCDSEGRDVLGIRRDVRSVLVIERVAVDYQRQRTRLRVLKRRRI